ncbi:MAG: RsiV family protein [Treponema sp.]|jgi:hypothetical protein|nr:RsiV family protein [Treponema sp.]
MRKIVYCGFVFGLLFTTAACTSSSGSPKKAGVQQRVYEEESILFFPDRKDQSPKLNLNFTLLDISGSEAERQFLQSVLYQQNTPEKYREKIIGDYKNEYLQMGTTVAKDPDFPQESLNWFYDEIMETTMLFPQGIVIRRNRDYYTGGAHGMRETAYFVLDLEKMKRLNLEDIIKPGSEPALMKEVTIALRDISNLAGDAPLSSGNYFEDTIEVPKNFFMSAQGLGFHWDPYEIAPYAVGPIEILIPYDKIKNLLTPQALLLIEKPAQN